MADIGSVAISSFLGALLGASSKFIEQQLEHRRRRRALATALLVELYSLDGGLRQLAESEKPSRSDLQIASHFFHRARIGDLPDLLLFTPQTVYEVMKFGGFVNKVIQRREAEKNVAVTLERGEYGIKVAPLFAIGIVESLKHSLSSEGGVPPRLPKGTWYKFPDLPPTPPSAFPAESDEGDRTRLSHA